MYYYAYIDDQKICIGTYGFPSQVTIPNYIYLGTADDPSVIGKKYNESTGQFEEVVNYYYAQLDEKDICIGVSELPSEVDDPKFIRLQTLDQSLVGLWYDRVDSTFKPAPFHVLADHSTDVVNYRDTDRCLSDELDAKAVKTEVYNKAQADAKFALKGEEGEGGANGASAYEVAVANGFDGTEAEWLASLKGEKGDKGDTGAQGPQGAQGVQGEKGDKGDKGDPGAAGEKGDTGLSAYDVAVINGFSGTQEAWLASLKGDKGDKGDTGARGLQGIQGPQGPQGPKGDTGARGPAGADGADFGGSVASDIIRLNGTQALYKTSSMMTFGTNNLETMIAGSKIYSRVAIQTSSDKRLKEGIEAVNVKDMADFIGKLEIVGYSYIGDDKRRIGVIAQQMQEADGDIAKCFIEPDDEGYLTVSFGELVFPLIAAVQQLQKRVAELESK